MSGQYQLHILQQAWTDGPESVTALLAAATLGPDAVTIEANDVVEYDWKSQSITLTTEASARLLDRCPGEGPATCLHLYFIVTFGDRRLYSGVVWEEGSAMSAPFPTLYVSVSPDHVTLELWRGPTTFVDLPEIHDYFKSLGKLSE